MGGNVLHGVLDASDPVGLGVGDLDRELVLDGHDDLYGVEGIEAEIVAELRRRLDLRGVDLVEVLDHGEDTFLNLRGGEEGLGTFGGGEVHCSEGGWGGGGGGRRICLRVIDFGKFAKCRCCFCCCRCWFHSEEE